MKHVILLTGDLDNPDRDTAGMEKLKEAKCGCWMQRAWLEQCVDAADAWFKAELK